MATGSKYVGQQHSNRSFIIHDQNRRRTRSRDRVGTHGCRLGVARAPEFYRKRRALAWLAGDVYLAPVTLDYAVGHGQTHTLPLSPFRRIKGFKDSLASFPGHPQTGIHEGGQQVIAFAYGSDGQTSAGGHRLDRVDDYANENFAHRRLVA